MVAFRPSGRTCRGRAPSKKLHWTREEDDLLTTLVLQHGAMKWDKLATHIQGRSGKSCRIRWLNQLSPGLVKTPFSLEEKRKLLILHEEFGSSWSIIASFFPGRTDNQVKNQYHMLEGARSMKGAGSSPSNNLHDQFLDPGRGTEGRGTGRAPLVSAMPGRVGSSGNFIISDANTACIQGVQFIDFLGVGGSDEE